MIPINKPDITGEDLDAYFRLRYASLPEGKYVKKLESHFSGLFGEEYRAVFTASAKVSLFLLLKALDMKGNVLTSPLTCYSALYPIAASGLRLKYVDVDEQSFLMDEALAEEKIDAQSAAILAIALGGCPNRLSELREIARRHKLPLIEDCAQALGATYENQPLGSFGDFAFFSFTKHLSLTGGGILLSKNHQTIEAVRAIQHKFPKTPDSLLDYRFKRDLIELNINDALVEKTYKRLFLKGENTYAETNPATVFEKKGVLCRPTDFQAAMVLRQLERLKDMVHRRRKNAAEIKRQLANHPEIQFQKDRGKSSFGKLYAVTPHKNTDLINYMVKNGVDCKQLTKSHGVYLQKPVDKTRYLSSPSVNDCPKYNGLHDRIVEIPLSSKTDDKEIDIIVNQLTTFHN